MQRLPKELGLYQKKYEHDACGVGAVANINGIQSHDIVMKAKQVLLNLHHRGAAGADEVTGDGAGILFQMPSEFFRGVLKEEQGLSLPDDGKYGVAFVFNTKKANYAAKFESALKEAVLHYGMKIITWRDVPFDNSCLGEIALSAEPDIKELFIDSCGMDAELFERRLFLARNRCERHIKEQFGKIDEHEDFYITSMSSKTICYKGMFMADQLFAYYPDLNDERCKSAIAVVHQRYSTNTFPSWKLAHPFRCIAHNGEINTMSGNRKKLTAREPLMRSEIFGDDINDLFPVVDDEASDSASFDNCLELLTFAGRSLPHAMMMMVPEAFGPIYHMSADKRAFYEYHSCIMEPWDGPAALVFTDGKLLGGTLDRNGLRPCRYVVTKDGTVVMGSEVGVVEFPANEIIKKGRLQPGRMFLVDTEQGRIINDNEIKSKIARQKPYRRWVQEQTIQLRGLFDASTAKPMCKDELYKYMNAFGYTREDLRTLVGPMANNGQEPIGSMGIDIPLAVLSDGAKLLYDYFKQLFAQVTNPPIDPLREGLVMSLMGKIGKQRNLLAETAEHANMIRVPHPILTNEDMDHLRSVKRDDVKVATIDSLFDVSASDPAKALESALDKLVADAEIAIKKGATIIVISDRNFNEHLAPIPSLLAASAVHSGLQKRKLRAEAGLIVESGEAREVMHFCLLTGFGIDAVNPYLAIDSLGHLQEIGDISRDLEPSQLIDNYIASIKKGILKTMSKMGISTLRSYRGAQLFEAIGLEEDFVNKYFVGTSTRISGIGLSTLAVEAVKRHARAFEKHPVPGTELEFGGEHAYRNKGDKHMWNPISVTKLQEAVRSESQAAYDVFANEVNDQSKAYCTLRGLMKFKKGKSISIDAVEPASEIVKRFCTGAMSHGSISKEVHECMAIAMNRIGGMNNTGEGGEDPARYIPEANGDSKNSSIKQVASGRFGVTINYLSHAKEIQIKMAQGAKPGEGGQLPGHKVTEEIANMRYSTPGVTLISPPPHHDIYSIEDLAQLIFDLKCSNPGCKVSVKLVSEVGVGTIAAGVSKGNADEVLISGFDGGTGASPMSSIKHAGLPWELGLAETQQTLILNGLRDRIRVQTDGQLRTGRDVAIAALLGAEQFGFGTSALVTLGCIIMRKCHLGTCPAGIATQNPSLRKCFSGKPEHLTRYMMFVAEELRAIMAELGFSKIEDMVGRSDMLEMNEAISHWKAKGLDFSKMFYMPEVKEGEYRRLAKKQANKLEGHFDWPLVEKAKDAIENKTPVTIEAKIKNQDRTACTILSNAVTRKYELAGLPEDTITLNLTGSAGQSFCAFLCKGITVKLTGDANDYVGKGLSGGKIIIKTPENSPFTAHENIIVGNTLLYGATTGEVYINGMAGERFAVRNSGATAVVEGVGDHGCEYMTNGRVIVIGNTGRNFAAGMSGGIAYVLDEHQLFDTLCNLDMVDLEFVYQKEDADFLKKHIEKHFEYTGSKRAKDILDTWDDMVGKFVKVMPIDYRRAMERLREREDRETETTPATEEVFNNG